MCRLLGVTRSLVYYHLNKEKDVKLDEDEKLIEEIKEIFRSCLLYTSVKTGKNWDKAKNMVLQDGETLLI